MNHAEHNRRRASWEVILTLVITLLGWAYTAGVITAHQSDDDRRLQRIEEKVDTLQGQLFTHEHGVTR